MDVQASHGAFFGGFDWSYDGEGCLAISGVGVLTGSSVAEGSRLADYQPSELKNSFVGADARGYFRVFNLWGGRAAPGPIRRVVIGRGVTAVECGALSSFRELESVSLPDGLEVIGDYAFRGCGRLAELRLPDGLAEIGRSAFYECVSLRALTFPSSLKFLGSHAFYGCAALSAVAPPAAPESIGSECFAATPFAAAPEHRENGAVYLGSTLLCAADRSLRRAEAREGTALLADEAFLGCRTLSELTLPSSLERIGRYAFMDCPLRSVILRGGAARFAAQSGVSWYGCESAVTFHTDTGTVLFRPGGGAGAPKSYHFGYAPVAEKPAASRRGKGGADRRAAVKGAVRHPLTERPSSPPPPAASPAPEPSAPAPETPARPARRSLWRQLRGLWRSLFRRRGR